MNILPTITEQDIRTFVGEQNFLKGRQHVRDGAIVNPEQQAMVLKAYCYGSLPEPYRVQVTFDGTGITAALCSCSTGTPTYENRGCEHTAALLLAWNEQPEAFIQMDDIDTILERQSKAQLMTLVKQLQRSGLKAPVIDAGDEKPAARRQRMHLPVQPYGQPV